MQNFIFTSRFLIIRFKSVVSFKIILIKFFFLQNVKKTLMPAPVSTPTKHKIFQSPKVVKGKLAGVRIRIIFVYTIWLMFKVVLHAENNNERSLRYRCQTFNW